MAGPMAILRADDNLLLDFGIWQHHMDRPGPTVRASLHATRLRHTVERYTDPLQSLKRRGEAIWRKHPVTGPMTLRGKRQLSGTDAAAVAASVPDN